MTTSFYHSKPLKHYIILVIFIPNCHFLTSPHLTKLLISTFVMDLLIEDLYTLEHNLKWLEKPLIQPIKISIRYALHKKERR